MHERGLVGEVVARLLTLAEGNPLSEVTVAIGPEMYEPVAEDAWRSAVFGTNAEDAKVRWVEGLHLLSCFQCSAEYRGAKLDRCPSCGGDGLVLEPAPDVALEGWHLEGEL